MQVRETAQMRMTFMGSCSRSRNEPASLSQSRGLQREFCQPHSSETGKQTRGVKSGCLPRCSEVSSSGMPEARPFLSKLQSTQGM